jgi:hypothetical protein
MLDLITVVFQPEIPYLEIQAKSIDQNFDEDQIKNIYIVVNDQDSIVDLIPKSWWGKFADRVIIYPYSTFGYVNRVGGWDNQQLCKLLAAARSTCEWSVVLDAKTFFVKPFKIELFLDSDNHACTAKLLPQPVFESAKLFVESLYNIELDYIIGPGGVPFLFHTQTVNFLIQDTEELTKKPFIEFFLDNVCYPNLITEFYLYSAYVKYKYGNFDKLYVEKQRWNCVNIAEWEADNFDELFLSMQKFLTLTVSIASKTWVLLSEEKKTAYLEFLNKRNLITDTQNTQKKLNTVIN